MQTIEFTDENGRNYKALQDGELRIILGPPEGLVDELELPEPFATRLHNVLYQRGLFNYKEVTHKPNQLLGALQEVLRLDVQKLTEAFFKYEHPAEREHQEVPNE